MKLREACGSPKGARKRDGLDVEAVGGMAEVQKEQESVTDWTLKLRGSRQRSKRSKKACRIGRQSNTRVGKGPKCTSNPGRLYIKKK